MPENITASRSLHCNCTRDYEGSQCEIPVRYIQDTYVLTANSGAVETPNYPEDYPVAINLTWKLELQPYERLTLYKHSPVVPSLFEECCDSFSITANGTVVVDFKSVPHAAARSGQVLTVINSHDGKTTVDFNFFSDKLITGPGLQITYNITCIDDSIAAKHADNACMFGVRCRVTRPPPGSTHGSCLLGLGCESLVGPVHCDCAKGFSGDRCQHPLRYQQKVIELREASGAIKTPNYPGQYPNATTVVWKVALSPFQQLTIDVDGQPAMESCCDTVTLSTNESSSDNELLSNATDGRHFQVRGVLR